MSFNKTLSCSRKELYNQEEEGGFDYSVLDSKTKIILQEYTKEIKILMKRTAQDVINIGQKLLEAKEQLGHGHFEDWLKAEFKWGQWTARKFMQVTRQFKNVTFADLSIDASALYVLASPSTPELVRQEALKRAGQGEVITHAKVKEITKLHKELTKPMTSSYAPIDITPESIIRERFHPAQSLETSPVIDTQNESITQISQNKLPDKKTGTPIQSQISRHFNDIVPNADKSDCPLKDSVKIETELLFGVGHLLCITDFNLKNHKWLGEVAEIKEVSATDIQLVIRISLQAPTD
jgi:hypothetical protein